MGKILSFVILCIINFAVCRKALELDQQKTISIGEFRGLINGDDCCFPISNFDHWVGCSSMVGLFNSIGKTFTSREFVEMNSRTFILYDAIEMDGDFFNCKFREVPFINFGLMKGLVRSEGGEDVIKNERTKIVEACSRMGWCSKELVKGFEFLHKDLDYLFHHYHYEILRSRHLDGIPYYVPTWLGGLGLSVGNRPDELISDVQRKAARLIFQDIKNYCPVNMSQNKTCLLDSIVTDCQNSSFSRFGFSKAERKVDFQILETEGGSKIDLEKENQTAYNLYIEQFWRNLETENFFLEMDDNFVRISDRKASKKLYHNQLLWQRSYGRAVNSDSQPLPWFKIWHQSFKDVKPIIAKDATRSNREHIMLLLQDL